MSATNPPPTLIPTPQVQTQTQMKAHTTPSSPYPLDCLVFVRTIHPGTNKTTLKSLFSQAFQDQDRSGQGHERAHTPTTAGPDYVDFRKGTDTVRVQSLPLSLFFSQDRKLTLVVCQCHLRLASPDYTTRLIDYFDTRSKTQAHELDVTGRTPLEDDKSITMERVRGKKEELHWDKIPEKVRRQAVDKAVGAQLAIGAESSESLPNTTHRNNASGSGYKKRIRSF